MLAWIVSQSAHLELAAGLQGTYHCPSLLPRLLRSVVCWITYLFASLQIAPPPDVH